ncbi:MsnO8 family LLM class oxidoreductase [Streptococcus sp. zg-86]|uniref:MsnO8 family LLM class oxidoreductase n=1 Tax=Streptococcus zhangguiae TaxID=2664091 RepID=A0A6I4RIA3_9STRE|nr:MULTISPECIES: LLM class flavin-dependent oxidoreductase [unclassified Streptococcus]MTB64550.1 MsnO8 family LLM class oxidoreductase [Streptococcus sp. zg-86]MTB90760.1 MsnO8 family LLM class oxidoreductase [Streptococcus sp. zg-36]MWV56537.1 MsnO8 family LLM class oxidoreductase [Streptococcus sp. zg-70]QTH47257.1 LLM class flavin-dependent oxidoreductase [Streptococcus sp. zg-86]
MELSALNLVPLRSGQNFHEAIEDMVELAQQLEGFGYKRYWIAEHHNSKTIASSATQLLIQHTLSQTNTIRVGSGGVMLPNHSPYLIAEQYGTLETLYPKRIDLGLGRAPGTDMQTAQALRRSDNLNPDFETDLAELESYFKDSSSVHAYPAAGLDVPFYILGSSTDSAHLAAKLGRPYVFAAHFAPAAMEEAIRIYRQEFTPSSYLDKPYLILALNAILAETDEEAKVLATSQTQTFLSIVTNAQKGLQPPKASEDDVWRHYVAAEKVPHFGPVAFTKDSLIRREKAIVQQMSAVTLVGSPDTVARQIAQLHSRVQMDEIMANSFIYDQTAQAKSYELLAKVIQKENSEG